MTRPAILNEDVVVVPRDPTQEMYDMYWQQTGESREMYSRVRSRAQRHHSVMLAESPHADAWAEVRAYVVELETDLAWLRENSVLMAIFNVAADRTDAADTIAALTAERDALLAALTESETERQEQSRLLGMSAERELAMLARKETAERALAEAVDALEPFADCCPISDSLWENDEWWDVHVKVGTVRRARAVVRKVKT